MRALTVEEIISQIIFWTIVVLSVNIAWLFYKSQDGRLRVLVIELFLSKIWVYGLAATYYLCLDFGHFRDLNVIWVRIICNAPMFWIMLKLRNYIVNKK